MNTSPRALEGVSLTLALKLKINNYVKITANIVNMTFSYIKNTKHSVPKFLLILMIIVSYLV